MYMMYIMSSSVIPDIIFSNLQVQVICNTVYMMYIMSSSVIPDIIFSNEKYCRNRQFLSQKLKTYMNNLVSDSGSSKPLVFIFSKVIIVDLWWQYKTINYNQGIGARNGSVVMLLNIKYCCFQQQIFEKLFLICFYF